MKTVVHITHEATHKIGGIGTVLEGLLTARNYGEAIDRSILVGTWSLGTTPEDRLGAGGRVLYSVCDGIDAADWRRVFRPIEEKHRVWITYGVRTFRNGADGREAEADVLLIETSAMDASRLNYLKGTIYQRFGITCADYESSSDFDLWLRVAEPAYDAVMALLDAISRGQRGPVFFVGHEYMGMPTVLKAIMERDPEVYTVFYAHEVATVRPHVENHPGHDTRFYNLMRQAKTIGLHIEDVLGNQFGSYRHALISRATECDGIFAVGDQVVEEFRFLSPAFDEAPIDLVYNGIPAVELTLDEKRASKKRLVDYCENLLSFRPDHVLTHVTRLVLSKGLWRDIRVLEHLDAHLHEAGRSAVLFVLSTEIGLGRSGEDVRRMEAEYGWPVVHREGYPDLVGQEIGFNQLVTAFNLRSRAVKVVFVNQFGWSRERCGNRMPEEMEFMDIRKGSDAEFGQSIYEPFGIAQLEPLSFGAICVVTNVCGCVGFVRRVTGGEEIPNVIVADYVTLSGGYMGIDAVSQIGWAERDVIEQRHSAQVANALFERLPTTDAETETMMAKGYEIAREMSWEVVVRDFFLPGLERAERRRSA